MGAVGSATPPQSPHSCSRWLEELPGAAPLSSGTTPCAVHSEGANAEPPIANDGSQCSATARTRSQTERRQARDFTGVSIAVQDELSSGRAPKWPRPDSLADIKGHAPGESFGAPAMGSNPDFRWKSLNPGSRSDQLCRTPIRPGPANGSRYCRRRAPPGRPCKKPNRPNCPTAKRSRADSFGGFPSR